MNGIKKALLLTVGTTVVFSSSISYALPRAYESLQERADKFYLTQFIYTSREAVESIQTLRNFHCAEKSSENYRMTVRKLAQLKLKLSKHKRDVTKSRLVSPSVRETIKNAADTEIGTIAVELSAPFCDNFP